MGYTTEFKGAFELNHKLSKKHQAYLEKFSATRRMKRAETLASALPDPIRLAVDLSIGQEGEFFVGGKGFMGQDDDPSVIEHNYPPTTQPSLWCHWIPSANGDYIVWDEGEKFYFYADWLNYLIENFLEPWGYVLNGSVLWQGEDIEDRGELLVTNNVLEVKKLD